MCRRGGERIHAQNQFSFLRGDTAPRAPRKPCHLSGVGDTPRSAKTLPWSQGQPWLRTLCPRLARPEVPRALTAPRSQACHTSRLSLDKQQHL